MVVEQSPLIEVQDLVKGIFVVLALHYVFNMQYNCRLCDFYLFFEDNILSIPTSLKKVPRIVTLQLQLNATFDPIFIIHAVLWKNHFIYSCTIYYHSLFYLYHTILSLIYFIVIYYHSFILYCSIFVLYSNCYFKKSHYEVYMRL